ncbi:MAG TPA: hypothetical protein QF683_01190 [SAR324 cluster bacterium]|jgi:hypothetical protein|nr:hypothetical protein [SAR324 cluster bacterium]MDP7332504.1 hypothetical protein [SAR324 cluster bacterium]MDP7499175.1 hypothetical protein [SAR324 cluster bacterium]HJO43235.1 hypothetical protein [SAR324 cluster bacterium]|tara:strand:- start:89 stop:280 length:192 start_codon:yes stop_codon:yes gene_type:complete
MLNSFDPKEKKAILLFIALLILGAIYLSTHRIDWSPDSSQRQIEVDRRLPSVEEEPANSGRYL